MKIESKTGPIATITYLRSLVGMISRELEEGPMWDTVPIRSCREIGVK